MHNAHTGSNTMTEAYYKHILIVRLNSIGQNIITSKNTHSNHYDITRENRGVLFLKNVMFAVSRVRTIVRYRTKRLTLRLIRPS